ncbi:DNA repair protein RAD51 homolog 4 isoform X1 [Paramormyrops kingsleyae]|uniref:DNA repair protein RAD51 homolog 4 n=2 Tax=Paramormyrops kingsleyae TaxID=1676925 RepID=A0A3B3SHT7_9TELE|nr:DNA repair protein RAD51 homolog 4 isoform X1 [Paramormyrops kingsleyae]
MNKASAMVFLREGLCPGLTDEVVQALRAKNIRTVVDLVSSDIEDLAQKCSVSYKTLLAVRRVLLAQNSAFPVTGADLYEELLSSTAILSTGNASLDKLLDSGLYTGELSELVGAPGTGKTQICLGVAVNISCEVKQSVLYIDSTGGLSANRLLQMIKAKISNAEEQMEALGRIQVCPVFDVFSLFECLHHFRSTGLQQSLAGGSSVKAVIVDSVSAVLANMLGGKQTEGMSLMMQVAGELRTLAKDLNVAVLVTNHVTRDGNGMIKAGLGQSWSHIPRTRVLLQRIEQPRSTCSSLRTATLIKSSRWPCYSMEEIDLRYWGQCEEKLHGLQGKRKQVSNSPS